MRQQIVSSASRYSSGCGSRLGARADMHIVDRRLNPRGKSLENRQRFLRRAKALVQRAVEQSSAEPRHSRCPEGRRGRAFPLDGMDEPRFRRGPRRHTGPGAARQQEIRRRRHAAALERAAAEGRATPAKARARTRSASCSPARSSSICSSTISSCPTSPSGAWPRPSMRRRAAPATPSRARPPTSRSTAPCGSR